MPPTTYRVDEQLYALIVVITAFSIAYAVCYILKTLLLKRTKVFSKSLTNFLSKRIVFPYIPLNGSVMFLTGILKILFVANRPHHGRL